MARLVAVKDLGRRWLRLRAIYARVRTSLFFVPAVVVIGFLGVAQLTIVVDRRIGASDLPEFVDTTVASSRAILAALAGGTITAASVVFSLAVVAVQLASSQYSPRTLGSFLGDRFQQMVIGVVLGTFSYCLWVLRVVRGPLEEGGTAFVPRISTALAVLLGVAALVAVIGYISHTAQGLRVENVAARITDATIGVIAARFRADPESLPLQTPADHPADGGIPSDAVIVASPGRGWVQQLSARALVDAVPEGTTIYLEATVGDYLLEQAPIAYLSPPPEDGEGVAARASRAVALGNTRTLQQDVAYGIVQLTDIALRALSPGVNDPQTAKEILARLGAVLVELAVRDLTPDRLERDGRTLIRRRELRHREYFALAFEPIRRAARREPQVLVAVLRTLATVRDEARRRRPDAHVGPTAEHADLLLAELQELATDADRSLVLAAARDTGFRDDDFGPAASPAG